MPQRLPSMPSHWLLVAADRCPRGLRKESRRLGVRVRWAAQTGDALSALLDRDYLLLLLDPRLDDGKRLSGMANMCGYAEHLMSPLPSRRKLRRAINRRIAMSRRPLLSHAQWQDLQAEGLQSLSDHLLRLTQVIDDASKTGEVFRIVHAIKGAHALRGYERLTEAASRAHRAFDIPDLAQALSLTRDMMNIAGEVLHGGRASC